MEQQQKQRGLCSFTPGRSACCGSIGSPNMHLSITSTTGSPVELTVPRGETVEGLRIHVSHKLRMQTDRIVLLHRDRQLTAGRLLDLGVTDGSKLTLVPVVEAGLCSTAKAERGIMDVLESLTEVQIRDFLSGRSPLTLNLGIGAHMMYVQLQLSAQNVAELQQQHQDLRAGGRKELQAGLPTAAGMSSSVSASAWSPTNTAGTSKSSTQAPNSSDSASMAQSNSQRSRTSLNSSAPSFHSSTPASANSHCSSLHQSCPPQTPRTFSPVISTTCLPSGCPHPSSPLQAETPVCSPPPNGSMAGPSSPAPATTFNECNTQPSSPAEKCKQPGAVIESFVSHSPGVFSGTFSGTLAPCSQSSISHPRGGVTIILQILNDLLRAAFHHQGAPPAVHHPHSAASNPPVSPLLATGEQSKAKSKILETQRTENLGEIPDEERPPLHVPTQENQALHCKLERLQFLMQQRRTRRKSHLSQSCHPYQHHHHQHHQHYHP